MRTKSTWLAVVLALGIAGGCGDDGGVITVPDGGPGEDSGPPDSGVRPDSGPMTDGNDSFAEAQDIEVGGDPVEDAISRPGDMDYFTFEGTEGAWLWISTTANEEDDPEMIDTVVTLYDSSMTMIAENDDRQPRVNTDSELITRLPSTGTYYLLVQEWSSWADETAEGAPGFTYELDVTQIAETGGGAVNVDAEAGDDAATAQAMMFQAVTGGDINVVIGTFDDGTDVDVYSFSTVEGRPNTEFQLMPGGATGYGSTGQPARMWITNAAGDEIVARMAGDTSDPESELNLQPSLPTGDYLLWVEHPAAAGANDFYVLKGFKVGDNPLEMSEATNGTAAGAEALAFMADPDVATIRRGFILARIGEDVAVPDVDYYSVTTMGTEQINVFCGSRTSGSGVIDLTVDVLNADGTPLATPATGTETATMGVALQNVMVPEAGTYLVRLTKASQDMDVTGDWVRCGVALAPPAATP